MQSLLVSILGSIPAPVSAQDPPSLQTLSKSEVLSHPESVVRLFRAVQQGHYVHPSRELDDIFEAANIDLRTRIANTCPSMFVFLLTSKQLENTWNEDSAIRHAIIQFYNTQLTGEQLIRFWNQGDLSVRRAH